MKLYTIPVPILNKKELKLLDILTEKYKKLTKPSKVAQIGAKIHEKIPDKIKESGEELKNKILEQELYRKAMETIAEGFTKIEEIAAKFTVSVDYIIKQASEKDSNDITDINEICLLRSYNASKISEHFGKQNILAAFVEGAGTGVFGFAGIPFNLVLSTFIYFRSVQCVAMSYGYDVKNDPEELAYAGQVFVWAISGGEAEKADDVSGMIGKIMMISSAAVVKDSAKKGWAEMAGKGGMSLLLAQMRALANKAAKKAVEKAGKEGLEKSIFKNVYQQIGKRLTLKAIQRGIPFISAGIGALFDSGEATKIIRFADTFYHKRFILEKEERINDLNKDEDVIDVTPIEG